MRRGDVAIVALPGDLGKPRPAVIVQTDILNDHLRTVLCPLTSFSSEPTLFRLAVEPTAENGLKRRSEIMVEKIQAANWSKVGKAVGRLDDETMRALARCLIISLGLTEQD